MLRRRALVLIIALFVQACATPLPSRRIACDASLWPSVEISEDGQTASACLSVLTYNIEGLGWPARRGRAPHLKKIGERLRALREAGSGPDIVMFQEMFSGAAKKAVGATGYPAIVTGPRRTTRSAAPTPGALPGNARISRGELGVHFTSSGLAIASRYPVTHTATHAYGRKSCAGVDCLSNTCPHHHARRPHAN